VAQLTWTGGDAGVETAWDVGANWDINRVPQAGDEVTIPDSVGGLGPIFSGSIALASLTVGYRGLQIKGSITTSRLDFVGGWITGEGTLISAGTASITTGSDTDADNDQHHTGLLNGITLRNLGSMTISGPGGLMVSSAAQIENSGSIHFDGTGLYWSGGVNPKLVNDGEVRATGTVQLRGGDFEHHATLEIDAGAEVRLSAGAELHLAGGHVSGTGTLRVASAGAVPTKLLIERNTVLPSGVKLAVSDSGLVTTPAQTAPRPALTVNGALSLEGGIVRQSTIKIGPTARCTVKSRLPRADGAHFVNDGRLVVAQAAQWTLDAGSAITNRGRMELHAGSELLHSAGAPVQVTNEGLVDSSGVKPNRLVDVTIANTGNVAVAGAALDLVAGAALDVAGGAVFLKASVIDSSDGAGKVTVRGGTGGGVLRGAGTVRPPTTNGGWVEPDSAGLSFPGGYTQGPSGSLRIRRAAWNAGAHVPVTVTGVAKLDGSVFVED
jgi:hypothetical protein